MILDSNSTKTLENNVLDILAKQKEGCAFTITDQLYPGMMENWDMFRAKKDEIEAVLLKMAGLGAAEDAGEFGGVRFFSPGKTSAAEANGTEDVEKRVYAAIQGGETSASDIAAVLFPIAGDLRPRTSQVYVCLKRLEKKGLAESAGKRGKKQFFRAAQSATAALPQEPVHQESAAPAEEANIIAADSHHEIPEEVKIMVEHAPLIGTAQFRKIFSIGMLVSAAATALFFALSYWQLVTAVIGRTDFLATAFAVSAGLLLSSFIAERGNALKRQEAVCFLCD